MYIYKISTHKSLPIIVDALNNSSLQFILLMQKFNEETYLNKKKERKNHGILSRKKCVEEEEK